MKESILKKLILAFSSIAFIFSLAILPGYADTLTLTGVGSGQTTTAGNEYVGPYRVSVNGNPVDMFCLDLNRNVSVGQTWQANYSVVSLSSSYDVKTATYILASTFDNPYVPTQSSLDAQMEIWAITDYSGALADGLTLGQEATLSAMRTFAASNFLGNEALSQFTLETATGPDGNLAQDFLGRTAVTPEPSSLLLMGTGLLSSVGMFYRKMRAA